MESEKWRVRNGEREREREKEMEGLNREWVCLLKRQRLRMPVSVREERGEKEV